MAQWYMYFDLKIMRGLAFGISRVIEVTTVENAGTLCGISFVLFPEFHPGRRPLAKIFHINRQQNSPR